MSLVSARYAAIKPKSGSSGAWGTALAGKLEVCGCDMCAAMFWSLCCGFERGFDADFEDIEEEEEVEE